MIDRSDRIVLAPNESRCVPGRECSMHTQCARARALIPQGTPLEDFTTGDPYRVASGGTSDCPGYLPLRFRTATVVAPAEIKPAVHGMWR